MTLYISQLLTGHGCFNRFLHQLSNICSRGRPWQEQRYHSWYGYRHLVKADKMQAEKTFFLSRQRSTTFSKSVEWQGITAQFSKWEQQTLQFQTAFGQMKIMKFRNESDKSGWTLVEFVLRNLHLFVLLKEFDLRVKRRVLKWLNRS